MKRFLSVLSLLAVLMLASCSTWGARPTPTEPYGVGGGGGEEPSMYVEPNMPAPTMTTDNSKAARVANLSPVVSTEAQTDRLVIQNVDMSIVVRDVAARLNAIEQMAQEMGGYVVSANLYQNIVNGVKVPEAQVMIRVPVKRLNEALEKIKADTVDVPSQNQNSQDVTAEYVDLQSRLKNLEAAEAQLLKIMEKAEKTEDVLAVFNQLTSIREQIEVIKGQIKYYEESAALSAISVHIVAEASVQPIEVGGWKINGWVKEAIQDLIFYLQGFVRFLIRFVLFTVPVLITIALPLYLVFLGGRAVVRRWIKPKVRRNEAPEKKE